MFIAHQLIKNRSNNQKQLLEHHEMQRLKLAQAEIEVGVYTDNGIDTVNTDICDTGMMNERKV